MTCIPVAAGAWCCMSDLPWLPYLAIDFLDNWLTPEMTAFEWGAGKSTGWLAQRVKNIVSIEHDPQWLIGLRDNIDLRIIPPEDGELGDNAANPHHYRSRPLGGINFKNYATAIDGFDQFNLILIDGRARASCLYHAIPKVAQGGFIVLDNTERDYYLSQVGSYIGKWNRVTFYGDGPENSWKWECSFFKK